MLPRLNDRLALRVALLAAVIFAAAQSGSALDPRRPLDSYTVDVWQERLPQQVVQSVIRTSDGALWLGTFEGIVRFNGIGFAVHDRSTHPEITEWRVRSLAEGTPGTLWAGTIGGGVLRYKDGAFRRFTTRDGLPGNTVKAVRRTRDGTMWFGTDIGLARLAGDRFERIATLRPDIESIAEAADGSLIVGAADGLYRLAKGELERIRLAPDSAPEPYVLSVAVMRNGDIWAGTQGKGVFRISSGVVTHIERIGDSVTPWITFILEDRDETIWLGLAPGGLARYADGRFELLERSRGLPSSSVKSAFEDVEGSLWIGTNGGLARIKDLKFFGYTMRSGLTEDYVRVVLEAKAGGLWVGTYGDGMNHVATTGKVTRIGTDRGLSDHYVRTIAEESDGSLWVGTGNGLNRIRSGTASPVVERIGAQQGFHGSKINAILVRRDGGVIVASDETPLQIAREGKFATFPVDRPDEASDARVLLEDRRGDLWVGTQLHGLLQFRDGRTVGSWTTRERLPSNTVFSLYESSNGDLWIGTHGGLALLRNGAITSFHGERALPGETIFQILSDERGFFWLTTNRGVIRVAQKSLEDFAGHRVERIQYTILGKRDGMPSDQCNGATQPAGVRLRDGRLALPTVGGLAIVDPADLRLNQIAPPVKITRIVVDRKPVRMSNPGDLRWTADRFEFHYEGLSLLQPEFVTYRYQLDGYDREWVDAGTRRVAFYNSLPPGAHTFRVQARNNDGVWSSEEAVWRFELATPPWRRWWAIAAYAVLLALLIAAISRMSMRVLRRETELLERKVDERTSQLQETNLRLMETSRELEAVNLRLAELSATDPLTSIANRRRFDQMLESEWRRSRRNATELSLLLIDIDHFKAFNDQYGHQSGDDALRQVALTLRDSFSRASDVVARYGGEEFAVLLPGTSLQAAVEKAERVRAAVEQLAIPHAASPTAPVITISLGVATANPATLLDESELVAAADAALYRAKRANRNRVHSDYARTSALPEPVIDREG